jgi:hypothetical protein
VISFFLKAHTPTDDTTDVTKYCFCEEHKLVCDKFPSTV